MSSWFYVLCIVGIRVQFLNFPCFNCSAYGALVNVCQLFPVYRRYPTDHIHPGWLWADLEGVQGQGHGGCGRAQQDPGLTGTGRDVQREVLHAGLRRLVIGRLTSDIL
jgi:hypothetical protein